jgi:hypothetical protein
VSNRILKHTTGLIRYRASRYFGRLPSRNAESGLLTLCTAHFLSLPSDPAVTSNALAIRIVFPLIGVTPVSLNGPGLPATLGKPKGTVPIRGQSQSVQLAIYTKRRMPTSDILLQNVLIMPAFRQILTSCRASVSRRAERCSDSP